MSQSEKTGAMTIGALCVAIGMGFAAKDWTTGLTVFGVLLYVLPIANRH